MVLRSTINHHRLIKKIVILFAILCLLWGGIPMQVWANTFQWTTPMIVDHGDWVGMGASLAQVNGNPAISYYNMTTDKIMYVRALDGPGLRWGVPVEIADSQDTIETSLVVVDGYPAVAFTTDVGFSNDQVYFVRATDANGTAWGTAQYLADASAAGGNISMAIVNGNPAISYYSTANTLSYIRASDALGNAWAGVVTVDGTANNGVYSSLAQVNGYPAIAYYDDSAGDLKFKIATDAAGSGWGTTQILDSGGTVGITPSLAVINGNAAISYFDQSNYDLKYIRASNAGATSWNASQTLDAADTVGMFSSLAVVNGFPAISYYYTSGGSLKFIQAKDANGLDWENPITLDPYNQAGLYGNSLAVINNQPAVAYYKFSALSLGYIRATGNVDVAVSQGGSALADGDSVDFGSTPVGTPVTRTLTVQNNGSLAMNMTGITLPDGFSLVGQYPVSIPAGGSGTFSVRLDGMNSGAYSGDLLIGSADTNQSPFTLALNGTVNAADVEIGVWDGATGLTSGSAAVDFGSTVRGTPITHTFRVENTGTNDLTLGNLSLPSGFSLAGSYDLLVTGGSSTNINVRLDAVSTGTYSGTFSLVNIDADENPFTFTISGVVTETSGEIAITEGGSNIADGTGSLDFGPTLVGTPVSRTFTVANSGMYDLDLYTLTLPSGFSLSGSYAHTVASGASTDITVRLDALTAGNYSGTFSLGNNDTDENPYNFVINGTVSDAPGEISVWNGAVEITDGTGSVDFGSTLVGVPVSISFTVYSEGTYPLDLGTLSLPTGFSLVGSYPASVNGGDTATLTVRLDALAAGSFSGVFSLPNDDTDENPFDFSIGGTVTNLALQTPLIAPVNGSTVINSQMLVAFNQDVLHDGGLQAANNPDNYLLVEAGANNTFETTSCAVGAAGDDVPVSITSVNYDISNFTATLNTGTLPSGSYQLLVCGTTSIWGTSGNELNNGVSDSQTRFTVISTTSGGGSTSGGASSTAAVNLPATGFAPQQVTWLPDQPWKLQYSQMDSLYLQMPSLKVDIPIVGVPQTSEGWDVTWLGGAEAGWLNGTAFPTWQGNTVLTGHVTDANGNPGSFSGIKKLNFGDEILLQAYGETHHYQVRENRLVLPENSGIITGHLDGDWITLVTCEGYDKTSGKYLFRRVVRAVLVDVD